MYALRALKSQSTVSNSTLWFKKLKPSIFFNTLPKLTVFSGLQVAPEYKPHPPIFA